MQRTLLASVIILSLSACDGKSLTLNDDNSIDTAADNDTSVVETNTSGVSETPVSNDTPVNVQTPISDDAGSSSSDGGETMTVVVNNGTDTTDGTSNENGDKYDFDSDELDDTNDDVKPGDDAKPVENVISDDAGSSTSDGGQVNEDTGNDNSDNTPIADDAASGTSDGGQVADDAASGTSDGGQVADDAASGTSDGGQVADDAASGSSDGGQIADDAASGTSDGGESTQGAVNTDAGDFASDNAGGDILRVSSLASDSTRSLCTTASNQNNFGDTRVGDFILHNNAWRPWRAFEGYEWEQCINTNTNGSLAGWTYDWGPGRTGINGNPNPSGDYYVRSYPELIYGVKDEFRTSAPKSVTGFPVRMDTMPNIRIDYSYDGPQYGDSRTVDASNNARFPNGTTISGERNVAIESFLYNADAAGNCSEGIVTRNGGSNHVYEVMVWLDAGAERLPAGPNDFVADLNIRGEAFKVYTKGADPRYIAFVAQNPQTTGTIYWNDFTDWARENAHVVRERFGARSNSVQIQDNWCVANIIVGTEIFWGAGNINIYDWTITQSR